MKVWRILTILLLSLVLLGSVACQSSAEDEELARQVEVVLGDLIVSVSGNGKIELADEAHLTFAIAGRLDAIYVEEGDQVSQGDVLARLETDSLELAISQAELAYTTAELAVTQAELAITQAQLAWQTAKYNLDKAENLYKWPELEIAQANIDRARSSVENAQFRLSQATTSGEIADWTANVLLAEAFMIAEQEKMNAMLSGADTDEVALKRLTLVSAQQSLEVTGQSLEVSQQSLELAAQSLELAQAQLVKTVLAAPFDGIIINLDADQGDTVSTLTPIIYLIDPGSLELNVEIDEIDIPEVKLGQRVIIEMDAISDRLLEGTVSSISLVPNLISGVVVYDTKIALELPPDIALRIGMSATADIVITEEKAVLLVPERAIRQDSQGRTIVEVVVNEQVEARVVVTGISDGFFTVISDGLAEGELVIEKRGRSK